jgi:trigger factor
MNIQKELVDELNAVIKINFTPADYQPKIDAQLKEYSKKVNMPGFRPGKVPAGMVKKMYGKSILVDELNKMTSDSLFNFIRENQIDILGNPLPKIENDSALNLDEPGEINFAFEIGLAPKFELDLSNNHRFNHYKVKVDDTFIDDAINNYRERLGVPEEVEISQKGDQVHGILRELDAEGNLKEAGLEKHVTFHPADLKESNQPEALELLKKDDIVTLDLNQLIVNPTAIAALLGIDKAEVSNYSGKFQFTIEEIKRNAPIAIGQEFFDQLFGEGVISSEEELREKVAEDAKLRYVKDANNRLFNEVVEHLVNNAKFELPNSFLKKWLSSVNEGKINPEDIESNYESYAKGIRWQLIEGKILKDNNIAISEEQVLESLTDDFLAYMGAAGSQDPEMRERAKTIAKSMLKNEKEVNKVYDRLYNEAMTDLFLTSFDVHTVELPFTEWVEQLNKPL